MANKTQANKTKKSKKERIVEEAIRLFNAHGIKKVTVEEICSESHTSKGTFYRNFSNKTDLIAHIATDFAEYADARFQGFMDEGLGFEELVKAVLNLKLELMTKYASLFMDELYEIDEPEIQDILRNMQQDSINNSLTMYELGIRQGKINREITAEFLLYQLEVLQETRTDPRVIAMYPDSNQRNMIIFDQFFYGLVRRE